jgi:hypothetical protein
MGSILVDTFGPFPWEAGSDRIRHRCGILGEVPNDTSSSHSEAQPSSRKVTRRIGDSEW